MAAIEEGRRRSSASVFSSAPPTPWEHLSSDYGHAPHSHHGTPAQEYSGFNFGPPVQSTMESSHDTNGRPLLQPLQTPAPFMPQYPSMLNAQSHSIVHGYSPPMHHGHSHAMVHSLSSPMLNTHAQSTSHQPMYHQPVQPIQPVPVPVGPLQTPVSASSSKSLTTPRKTLSDADRKRMCQYREDHPNAKQIEIGNVFGVERSTVSKVLRNKDKYLQQEEGNRSPHNKRAKGKLPDIERTLANWARNQERKGVNLTDGMLRERIRAFSATTPAELQQSLNSSWTEKFKLKYNVMGARSRKSSLAPDDTDHSAHATSGSSPISPPLRDSPSETELHGHEGLESSTTDSQGSFEDESPEGFTTFPGNPMPFQTQGIGSSTGGFRHYAPHPTFPSGTMSPLSPFYTPDSGTGPGDFIPQPPLTARPIIPTTTAAAAASGNSHRPRSQTFPSLDPYGLIASSGEEIPTRYISESVLDSPMEESSDPLLSLSGTLHGGHNGHHDHDNMNLKRTDMGSSFDGTRTISPSQTMRPPPLPSHVLAAASALDEANDGGLNIRTPRAPRLPMSFAELMVTSNDEARAALESVIGFFAEQAENPLDPQETVTLAKLVQKLKLQSGEAP